MDQVLGLDPVAGVERDQERVSDLWDLILLPGPRFAGGITDFESSNWNVFAPEINNLQISAYNFAP